jgi:uncharacterized membrane protein YgcG
MKTQAEIEAAANRAADNWDHDSKPYNSGVMDALAWVLEDGPDPT